MEENFNAYCCTILDDFIQKYATYYDESFNIKEYLSFTSASYKLNALNTYSKRKGTQLYLIIDEYDNFTNNILSEEGEAVYHSLTHAQGFYRDFFKLFKGMIWPSP